MVDDCFVVLSELLVLRLIELCLIMFQVQEMIELANKCSKMAEKPLQDFNKIVSETACSGFSSLLSAHSTNGSTTADHTNRQKISTTCDVTVSDRTINPPMPMSRG